jgi:hypothetical protein
MMAQHQPARCVGDLNCSARLVVEIDRTPHPAEIEAIHEPGREACPWRFDQRRAMACL